MSRAPDAPGSARPLAVPALALPARPALAGARAVAQSCLVSRVGARTRWPACARAAAARGALRGDRGRDARRYRHRPRRGVGPIGTVSGDARRRRAARARRSRRSAAARRRGEGRGPCPSTIISSAPGMARAVARPPEGETSGSALPWIDERRRGDAPQLGGAVARGDDRGKLAPRALGVVVAFVARPWRSRACPRCRAASRASRSRRTAVPCAAMNASRSRGDGAGRSGRRAARAGRCACCRCWT